MGNAAEVWHIKEPTSRARAAAVTEPCLWSGCKEERYPDKCNGDGRPMGAFKHLCLHAAEASAAVQTLEPIDLRHAALACGICGSSSAGCSIDAVVSKKGKRSPAVCCKTPILCLKMPSLVPSKIKGKSKNIPVMCSVCNKYVWAVALRSHHFMDHKNVEPLPPALSEAAIALLKDADRVKPVKLVTDAGKRQRQRRAHAARKESAAAAGGAGPAPSAKRSRKIGEVGDGSAAASAASAVSGGRGGCGIRSRWRRRRQRKQQLRGCRRVGEKAGIHHWRRQRSCRHHPGKEAPWQTAVKLIIPPLPDHGLDDAP